jgi:O-acetyl-ADP-ribose deacetylase
VNEESFLEGRLIVAVGDLTLENVDAIVNAANSTLLGGDGVDGAIHARGGPKILEECRKIRETQFPDGLPHGEAVVTTGGALAARYVIHTVGPIYRMHDGAEPDLLAACYRNSLRLAADHSLRSVSFPSISTGAFSYPRDEAARISARAILSELEGGTQIDVRLVFHSPGDAELFLRHSGL